MNKFLALGCSHTVGMGVDHSDCYVTVLGYMIGRRIKNRAVLGASYQQVEENLVHEIKNDCPDLIITQWPNPFRRTIWYGDRCTIETISSAGAVFHQLLKQGERNFYGPWLQSIITCNTLTTALKIPMINILLDTIEDQYLSVLQDEGIKLHVDEKQPDRTWLLDSAGSDNVHHSADCHAAWADRIKGLIDEITA